MLSSIKKIRTPNPIFGRSFLSSESIVFLMFISSGSVRRTGYQKNGFGQAALEVSYI